MCLLFTIILRLGSACRGFYDFLSGSMCGAGSSRSCCDFFLNNFQFAWCGNGEPVRVIASEVLSRVWRERATMCRVRPARLSSRNLLRADHARRPARCLHRNTPDCSVPFSLITINIISYALFSLSYHSSSNTCTVPIAIKLYNNCAFLFNYYY